MNRGKKFAVSVFNPSTQIGMQEAVLIVKG